MKERERRLTELIARELPRDRHGARIGRERKLVPVALLAERFGVRERHVHAERPLNLPRLLLQMRNAFRLIELQKEIEHAGKVARGPPEPVTAKGQRYPGDEVAAEVLRLERGIIAGAGGLVVAAGATPFFSACTIASADALA